MLKCRLLLMSLILMLICAQAQPANETSSIQMQAHIPEMLELIVDLKFESGTDIADDSLMNFGTLVDSGDGRSLVANEGIVAFIYVNSRQTPYTLYSDVGASLTFNTYEIPAGATTLVSVCVDDDQPFGNCSGSGYYTGSAIGNNIIYASDAGHRARVIQAHYNIGTETDPGGSDFVPIDQAAGAYVATLIITVVN